VLLITVAVAVGAPVLLFVIANILGSDTLGWIAGLSLMLVFISAVPLIIGACVGWMLAAKLRGETVGSLPEQQQATPVSQQSIPVDPHRVQHSALSPQQRGLLIAMAGVAASFWVLVWAGFRWNGQQPPEVLAQGILPAGLVLIVALGLGVRSMWRRRGTFAVGSAVLDAFVDAPLETQRRKWLASLAANPRWQRYAAMIGAGDTFWTPERIEYDLDPNATTCCEHLAPIESGMRKSGVITRLSGVGRATADCRIDADALSRQYELPACVAYEELHVYDRSIHDPPEAWLHCNACSSSIGVKHPDVAVPETPVFPPASMS
jgi:hypothetical protein